MIVETSDTFQPAPKETTGFIRHSAIRVTNTVRQANRRSKFDHYIEVAHRIREPRFPHVSNLSSTTGSSSAGAERERKQELAATGP